MTRKIQIIEDCSDCTLNLKCKAFKKLTKTQQYIFKNSKVKESHILNDCHLDDYNDIKKAM